MKILLFLIGGFSLFGYTQSNKLEAILESHRQTISPENFQYYDSLLTEVKSSNDTNNTGWLHSEILDARLNSFQGDHSNAMATYLSLIKGLDLGQNDSVLAEVHFRLGYLNDGLGNYHDALENFKKAIEIAKSIGDSDQLHYIKGDYAVLLANFEFLDSSETVFKEVATYYKPKNSYKTLYINTLANLAIIEEINGKYEVSRTAYKEVIDYHQEHGNVHTLITLYGNLGGNYSDDYELDSAEYFLHLAYHLSDSLNLLSDKYHNALNLSRMYELKKDYKKAFQWSIIESSLKDSVWSSKSLVEIGELTSEFEHQLEEEREARKLKEEQKAAERQANIQFFGIFLGIVFFFLLVFLSGKVRIPNVLADGMVFFAFVLLFEFLLVILDPFIDSISQNKPIIKLGCNVLLAVGIIPLHALFEKTMKNYIQNSSGRAGK